MDKHIHQRIGNSLFSVVINAEWYPDESPEVAIDWSLNERSGLESWCHFDGCFSIESIDGWDATTKRIIEKLTRWVETMEVMQETAVEEVNKSGVK